MINILIVDDSKTEALLLSSLFNLEQDMHVIGYAKNGSEAVKLTKQLKPDLITMDILMPLMDGFEATQKIMTECPTPIVVISSTTNDTVHNTTYHALNAGALCVLDKVDYTHPSKRRYLIDTIRSMSEIKIIKKRFFKQEDKKIVALPAQSKAPQHIELIAIGTSIGGPSALTTIFSHLPHDFPVPIVVVQHMTPGFMTGFTHWLDKKTKLTVKVAENQEPLKPGSIYFAPDSYHLTVKRAHPHLIADYSEQPPASGFRPSATVLLQSVAKACGKQAVGILLTGMGNDGAQGLLKLKEAHGYTVIQDAESAVVFGMAGVALSMNAVDKIVPLEKMAEYLCSIVKR